MYIGEYVREYISVKGLSVSTAQTYDCMLACLRGYFCKYKILPSEITSSCIRGFIDYMNGREMADSSKRLYLDKLNAILTYLVENGIISVNPFSQLGKIKISRVNTKLMEYIHPRCIPFLKDYFLSLVIDILPNGNWTYKYGALEAMFNKSSSIHALYFFCLGLTLGGMAPVDLCLLKHSHFQIID